MPEDVKFMQRAIELARHNALEASCAGFVDARCCIAQHELFHVVLSVHQIERA